MADKALNLTFAVAGIDRIAPVQSQPPYTCVDAENVRPFDVFENRGRGGSRPGLSRAFYDQLGSGNPIRLLTAMNSVQGDNFDFWEDSFEGRTFSSKWSQAEFPGLPMLEPLFGPLAPSVEAKVRKDYYVTANDAIKRGLVVSGTVTPNIDATKNRVGIFIVPVDGRHQGTFFLYSRMNVSAPLTDSIEAELAFSGAGYVLTVSKYVSGVKTVLGTQTVLNIDEGLEGWLILETTSATTVKCTWRGSVAYSGTVPAAAGNNFGFAMQGESSTAKLVTSRFRIEFYRTTRFELSRPRVFASSNGIFYREKWFTDFEVMPSESTLASDRRLFCAELYNKLYIADYNDPIAGASDGVMGSFSLQSATYPDWSAVSGLNIHDYSLQIVTGTDGTGPDTISARTYRLVTIGTTDLTVESTDGAVGTAGSKLVFRIVRNPKVFTPSDNPLLELTGGATDVTGLELTGTGLSLPTGWTFKDVMVKIISGTGVTPGWYASSEAISGGLKLTTSPGISASAIVYKVYPQSLQPVKIGFTTVGMVSTQKGILPVGCRVLVRHMGRALYCGDPTAPQAFYMSRDGDPVDFDTTVVDDAQAAYSGAVGTVGRVPDPIIDAMPWYRDYTFLACRSSLHLLIRNPRAGGSVEQISDTIGLSMPGAWCIGPGNELLFLSRDGLYTTTTTCMDCQPLPVSRGKVPVELIDVSEQQVEVFMEYDVRDHGVHIYLTYKESREGVSHWWYDYAAKGFFRKSIRPTMEPTSIAYFPSICPKDHAVLVGCRDGRIRRYLMNATNDDGYPFESKIALGPFRLGTALTDATLHSLRGSLAKHSGNVRWVAYVAETPEEVVDRYFDGVAAAEGEFEYGDNRTFNPMRRGASCILELVGVGEPWAMEYVAVVAKQLGQFR